MIGACAITILVTSEVSRSIKRARRTLGLVFAKSSQACAQSSALSTMAIPHCLSIMDTVIPRPVYMLVSGPARPLRGIGGVGRLTFAFFSLGLPVNQSLKLRLLARAFGMEIGRASCRERVGQYV